MNLAEEFQRYLADEDRRRTCQSRPPTPPPSPWEHGLLRASDIEREAVSWLWRNRIPLAKMTTVDGDPGQGKSTVTTDLAARVTRGESMPDGSRSDIGGAANVLIMTAEDGYADTLRPRLEAAGADLERVMILDGVPVGYDDDGEPLRDERGKVAVRPPSIPGDIDAIAEIVAHHDIKLVVIDPYMAYLDPDVNSYKDQDVRRAMHRLKLLAEESGAAVVVVRHMTKSTEGRNAVLSGGGSIGIVGATRSGLIVVADPEDEERHIVAVAKLNVGRRAPAFAYRIEGVELDGVETSRIAWDGEVEGTANDLLVAARGGNRKRGRPPTALADAIEFLTDKLGDGSKVRSSELNDAAEAAGIATATLKRAKKQLAVQVVQTRDGWFSFIPMPEATA